MLILMYFVVMFVILVGAPWVGNHFGDDIAGLFFCVCILLFACIRLFWLTDGDSIFRQLQQFLISRKDFNFMLGIAYERGKYYNKAMKYYKKVKAWREIGYMHYFGYGVPKNKDKANEYFAKCADIEDCKKVISYFERIANNSNDANALFNLGYCYAEGKGIYRDYQKAALVYYKKAADLGDSGACNNLGCMYSSGKGVFQSYNIACSYFQKVADLGNAIACNNLGDHYEYGRQYNHSGLLAIKPDKYKALKYYKKACDLGNQKGCENFRRLKNEMGIRLNLFDLDCFTDS